MPDTETTALCPRCHHPNPLRSGIGADGIIDCERCDRSFLADDRPQASPPETAPATDGLPTPADPFPALTDSPTEVSLAVSGLAGAVLTGVFYVIVIYPLQGTYFSDLFSERGWVPYAIALMSAWAGVILVAKYVLVRRQERAFSTSLLPVALGERITPANAPLFARHLEQQVESTGHSFLVLRLSRALQHFQARGAVREVVDQLGQHAQSDAEAVDASYTAVRTFIWAIPILGFIGTVLGIGTAVSGFSTSVSVAADMEIMKQSIGSVTTGLGVAFDTTLLALVMSILVMFPASWLQKSERGFLARVETYCDRHLVRRLTQPPTESAGPDAGVARSVRQLRGQFDDLAETIEELNQRLSKLARD